MVFSSSEKNKLYNARKKDQRASYPEKQIAFLFIHWHLIENIVYNYNEIQVIVIYWLTVSKDSDQLIFTNVFFIFPWSMFCSSPMGSTLK